MLRFLFFAVIFISNIAFANTPLKVKQIGQPNPGENKGPNVWRQSVVFDYNSEEGQYVKLNSSVFGYAEPDCEGIQLKVSIAEFKNESSQPVEYELGKHNPFSVKDRQDLLFYFRPGVNYQLTFAFVDIPEACTGYSYDFWSYQLPMN